MVQLMSKLTLIALNTPVFFNICQVTQSAHACDIKWAAHESTFVHCARAIFCALHESNTLCVT